MDEELKAKAIGHYDLTVAEVPNLYSYWEFRADGKAVQDEKIMGDWYIKEGCIIIAYDHKPYGFACKLEGEESGHALCFFRKSMLIMSEKKDD